MKCMLSLLAVALVGGCGLEDGDGVEPGVASSDAPAPDADGVSSHPRSIDDLKSPLGLAWRSSPDAVPEWWGTGSEIVGSPTEVVVFRDADIDLGPLRLENVLLRYVDGRLYEVEGTATKQVEAFALVSDYLTPLFGFPDDVQSSTSVSSVPTYSDGGRGVTGLRRTGSFTTSTSTRAWVWRGELVRLTFEAKERELKITYLPLANELLGRAVGPGTKLFEGALESASAPETTCVLEAGQQFCSGLKEFFGTKQFSVEGPDTGGRVWINAASPSGPKRCRATPLSNLPEPVPDWVYGFAEQRWSYFVEKADWRSAWVIECTPEEPRLYLPVGDRHQFLSVEPHVVGDSLLR